MTEAQILAWLGANWPSLLTTITTSGILFMAWLKVHKYNTRLRKVELALNRILNVCGDRHPERGRELFNGDGKDEE